ncbi:glycan-binding surface protein [Natronoflexus pectinivorans]|uniref:Surface glycan-binding protein B xyloglucan binding domain-containing protein n=1 Tax=Natronoflexus pectinivorans TaxID=682526 RepID=A0A4R2GNC3_9BACT|nr:glycan-binding surface protein [Natronoflexus pectinivorans]TCO10802.1 hypothetical protein EV194_101434 [Natronoflexus pectinivorans]
MKQYIKKDSPIFVVMLLLISIFAGTIFQSCDDDDDDNGMPEIQYIRITDPDKSDSLIVRAFLGNTIALVGSNLQNVVEIWFNDQPAKLNVNYITRRSIIVTIPNAIPEEVTNQITLVTRGGLEYKYDFQVVVPSPLLSSMLCEYVPDGEIAVIRGNYFIDDESAPLEVIFPGNIPGFVEEVSVTQVKVRVPEGTSSGPIAVRSIYGQSRSSFYFRDDRNIFLDFDHLFGAGWRPGNVRGDDPAGVSGNYLALTGAIADWDWLEDNLAMNLWGVSSPDHSAPLFDLMGNRLEDMVLKFEVNVVNPWAVGFMQLIFTRYDVANTNAYYSDESLGRALWRPWFTSGTPFQTDGWITVTIPMSEFRYSHNAEFNDLSLTYPDSFGGFTIFVWGPALDEEAGPADLFFAVDNIRVVPR